MAEKKIRKFMGVDMGSLEIGKPARIYLENGTIAVTSPVVSWFIHALSHTYRIETRNTIYEK